MICEDIKKIISNLEGGKEGFVCLINNHYSNRNKNFAYAKKKIKQSRKINFWNSISLSHCILDNPSSNELYTIYP